MTHAISWAAVSSKPQAERESLDDQHRLNHALAEALDWDIVADITVPGESRSYHRLKDALQNVEAYSLLAEYAQSANIDWLIVKDRTRLARTRRLNREVADFLQDHNIRVYSRAMPPADFQERTESDVWGEVVEGGLSEVEVMRLKQRREMGMQGRVKRGKIPSTLPWGFRRDGPDQVAFDDPQAEEVIRYVIDSYQAGITLNRIVGQAKTDELATPRGGDWRLTTVTRIVLQPCYYGLVAYGKRRTVHEEGRRISRRMPFGEWLMAEADFDSPYTPDDWRITMAEYERRREEHPRRRGTAYPLSGIAWCKICDLPMNGSRSNTRRYYRCQPPWESDIGRRRHHIALFDLHAHLAEHIREVAHAPGFLSALVESTSPDESAAHERGLLLEQADELLRRRTRWMDAYEDGAISLSDFSERVTTLDQEQDAVDARLAQADDLLARAQRQEDFTTYVREKLHELPDLLSPDVTPAQTDMLRAIASRIFRRIYVLEDGTIDVEWNTS